MGHDEDKKFTCSIEIRKCVDDTTHNQVLIVDYLAEDPAYYILRYRDNLTVIFLNRNCVV